MEKFKYAVAAVLALVVVILVLQNTQPVETTILFWSMSMPNAAMLGVTLLIGFALGVLFAGRLSRQPKQKVKQTNNHE